MPKSDKPDLFNLYLQLSADELVWEFGGAEHFAPDEIDFLCGF